MKCFGLHRWAYEQNAHGGRPMYRHCEKCGYRQGWNYEQARNFGQIVWERA